METTLGGNRLGSGNKQTLSLRNYERSTHDLSYVWRSTMAPGTLVPFMTEVGLPGDTFDIDLNVNVMTHPTIGPLFGSFKIQLDVFQCPMRLYNGKLHMNKLGIGMKMADIKLPQMIVSANVSDIQNDSDNSQINPSSILSYLNIRGIGVQDTPQALIRERSFNAIPLLAYWDIYKNYYANKQEEIGAMIHNPMMKITNTIQSITRYAGTGTGTVIPQTGTVTFIMGTGDRTQIRMGDVSEPIQSDIKITVGGTILPITEIWDSIVWSQAGKVLICTRPKTAYTVSKTWGAWTYTGQTVNSIFDAPGVKTFPLENIDTMREDILAYVKNENPFFINYASASPYGEVFHEGNDTVGNYGAYSKLAPLEGLAIKTYQSDLFNNWISTEWIDGTNGINEITSIDTSEGSFTIDTLNLSNKVYNMLNRIAVSGGTYDDWLDAVYTHDRMKSIETPVYQGSLIRELAFEEVVSNAGADEQPLGTLAGRGAMTGKKKGGTIRVKVDEPSYIMGIISLTPRLDYSQGNKWDVNLKTMDDLHKPALDEIGFQDLTTDQMAWWDTICGDNQEITYKSAGKQPAWINYMTNVNQCRGNFASKEQQMWMTLNRRYEKLNGGIKDLTTYIDPVKYNNIFADTSYDAQNFWVQISNGVTARRKMSAKLIPNL